MFDGGKFASMNPHRCGACRMLLSHCFCEHIVRHEVATKVWIVMHRREECKATATAPLALQSLVNSEMFIHGNSENILDFSHLKSPDRRTILLYPADDARVLDKALLEEDPRPVDLVVPDGNWRQAARMGRRLKGLEHAMVVKLPKGPKTEWGIREEPKEEGLATYEAISRAIGILEGNEIQANMEDLFRLMVKTTKSM